MNWLLTFLDWLERRRRRGAKKFLAMRVDRPPDVKTLDSLGQERRATHVRSRPDLS